MSDTDARVKELELLLEQEKGKNVALQREIADVKRHAKQVEDQAAALRVETDNSLLEAAEQMKINLAISQGVWALAHMGRAFLARKVAAARVVHREQQMCLLMERMIQNAGKDPAAFQTAVDQANHVITTVRRDGEATRVQVVETCLSTGLDEFMSHYDAIVAKKNDIFKGE